MNDTNRVANRLTLFVIGLVLLVVGAAGVTVMVWPFAADLWTSSLETARGWAGDQVAATPLGDSTANGAGLIAAAALLVLAILLVLSLTRLIGHRSRRVVRSGVDETFGRVIVTEAFASDALQRAFDARPDILFASVSANDVKKQPVLHVSVSPRQNTSPRRIVDDVDRLVTNLATLTGQPLPTVVSVRAGLRTRLAGDQRRVG